MNALEQALLMSNVPSIPRRRAFIFLDIQSELLAGNDSRRAHHLPSDFEANILHLAKLLTDDGQNPSHYASMILWITSDFTQRQVWDGKARAGGDLVCVTQNAPARLSTVETQVAPQTAWGSAEISNGAEGNGEGDEDEDEDDQMEAILRQRMAASRNDGTRKSSMPSSNIQRRQPFPTARGLCAPAMPDELFLSGPNNTLSKESPPVSSNLTSARALLATHPSFIDLQKSHYCAFRQTELLTLLRSSIITDLHICGPALNTSIFATAATAGAHGFRVFLPAGCHGLVNQEAAICSLQETYDVEVTSAQNFRRLPSPRPSDLAPRLSSMAPGPDTPRTRIPIRANSSLSLQRRSSSRDSASSSPVERTFSPTPRKRLSAKPSTLSAEEALRSKQPSPSPSPINRDSSISSSQSIILPIRVKQEADDDAVQILSDTGTRIDRQPTLPTTSAAASKVPEDGCASISAIGFADSDSKRKADLPRVLKKKAWQSPNPRLGPSDSIAEGDTYIVHDAFDSLSLHQDLFTVLKDEVLWQKMYHAAGEVPRLVCAQGVCDVNGCEPVYRHPSDTSLPLLPYSPAVNAVRKQAERIIGHTLNHCLVQLYRSGHDHISEHSDKTLDIVPRSSIVNASFGAERVMRLRTKRPLREKTGPPLDAFTAEPEAVARRTQLVPLPDKSMFVLGLKSNDHWLHGINPDKRPQCERTESELAHNGERISLTFRQIGTYLSHEGERIWGQGATGKTVDRAARTVNGDPKAAQELIDAFGFENQVSNFDRNAVYGNGFDVLHFRQDPGEGSSRLLFLGSDTVANDRVRIALEELGLPYSTRHATLGIDSCWPVCLLEGGRAHALIRGDMNVLLHLAKRYHVGSDQCDVYSAILDCLCHQTFKPEKAQAALSWLEILFAGQRFVAGDQWTVADVYVYTFVDEWVDDDVGFEAFPRVMNWHECMTATKGVQKVIWADAEEGGKLDVP